MRARLLLLLACVIGAAPPVSAAPVQEVVSPGGIKAWLVEEHGLPLVSVKIVFTDAGSAYDPPGREGRAGMAAAMLMEGAGEMDSAAFNAALEREAIRLSAGIDNDLLRVSLEALSEKKAQAFSYAGQALARPRFDDSALERVRAQALSILAGQERNPGYLLHRRWEQAAFGGHPYGQPSLGTKASLDAMTGGDLREFVRRYVSRENMLVAAVGDITAEELGRLLDASLAGLPDAYRPDREVPEAQLPETAAQRVVDSGIPQTMAYFGAPGLKREDPRYYAAYVLNHIVGGGGALVSRLGTEIRSKRGLAYSIHSQLEPMLHGAVWRGGFSTRNEKAGETLAALRRILKDMAENGPADREIEEAKRYLTGAFVLSLDSNADIAHFLIIMQLHHLGRDYLEKRNDLMRAVRKEDIRAVAGALLDPGRLLVVLVGRPNLAAGAP